MYFDDDLLETVTNIAQTHKNVHMCLNTVSYSVKKCHKQAGAAPPPPFWAITKKTHFFGGAFLRHQQEVFSLGSEIKSFEF